MTTRRATGGRAAVRPVTAALAVLLAAAALAAPPQTTRAAWTDAASVAATSTTVTLKPALTCTSAVLSDAVVRWPVPQLPGAISYTATRLPSTPLTIDYSPDGRTATVRLRQLVVLGTQTVRVQATYAGTTWTGTTDQQVVAVGVVVPLSITCGTTT